MAHRPVSKKGPLPEHRGIGGDGLKSTAQSDRSLEAAHTPIAGWFIKEDLIKMDDLWVPLFQETSI